MEKYTFQSSREVSNEAVQVVVRCRPMNERETADGHRRVVDVDPSRGVIEITDPRDETNTRKKVFTFDAVYDWNSRQEDLYEEIVRPLVSCVLDGFNATIFAYGQTGTGKTYTMEGSRLNQTEKGIIPRSFDQIFSHIARSSNMEYLVRSSYLEIYQEEIRDLLNKNPEKKHELREGAEGVYVQDLSSYICRNVKEIERIMTRGNQNRSIGTTNMNERSSRSHAIFMITVEMGPTVDSCQKMVKVGKLNLVDLAGSEKQCKTGTKGERLKEATKINLSLSALGNVISALVDGKNSHIPYRDSKLTRLLQDSLGGNSKTLMVANIGPASYNYDETLTTLRYANRAKNIKNQPRINEDPKDALLREYQMEIARLKAQLAERARQRDLLVSAEDTGKDDLSESSDEMSDDQMDNKDTDNLAETLEKKKVLLSSKKLSSKHLESQIREMESRLLCGGKNIIDHTNEQQKALEMHNQEIAERKKKEVEMRQKLEEQADTAYDIRVTYENLVHEVEFKTLKLTKLFAKMTDVKQEIKDVAEEYNRERRELQMEQDLLLKELKVKYLIIENFIPPDEKNKLLQRICYDRENNTWELLPLVPDNIVLEKRPVSSENERRPVSDYGRVAIKVGSCSRYQGENILSLDIESHTRTTSDYQGPVVAPKIQALLEEALRDEGDLEFDASSINYHYSTKTKTARKDKHTRSAKVRGRFLKTALDQATNVTVSGAVFPKARGLVPK
ncbi:kinesin-like protein KIF3B [Schistocerca piceifrons]|nr:kinesin-like protein KIF3B [Schistocerca piceifrons]XP_049783541.1 kinesin-like protein KIF3B isoform X1 [Schistocerca cancellata]XP_049806429.1 kinesin-like protein KIF3B isoform X1 [Schistocerca nitens]XP_049847324.1 kinesin-like protein KIF3B isoform X1 [Schistocerca gregaria]XP_049847325.1 kinesin-like protein KIF3B isoform X1 [Schistocerca gregaria]